MMMMMMKMKSLGFGLQRRMLLSQAAAVAPLGCQRHALCTQTPARYGSSVPTPQGSSNSTSSAAEERQQEQTATPVAPAAAATAVAAPFRKVGNVLIVHCVDHPFKFSWEINRMLRDLRLEFMGQTVIVPDIPPVRKRLWRVRHIVRVDALDLDEAKALIGVPKHITFTDLNSAIPVHFGRGPAGASPNIRSRRNFMRLRRMHLRDVVHRDEVEKRLLEERRSLLSQQQQQQQQEGKTVKKDSRSAAAEKP